MQQIFAVWVGLSGMVSKCLGFLLLTGFAFVPLSASPPSDDAKAVYSYSADSVFALGDVHGAYDELIALLRGNQLIDSQNRWSGGRTHLVSLGDLVDRGARSRDVMDLFRRLQGEAHAAGGRVHVLLGNHEVMNLTGDLRDVSAAEFAAFADGIEQQGNAAESAGVSAEPRGYAQHRRAFAAEGEYGRWLLDLPFIVRINDTVFAHGGLSPLLGNRSLVELNASAHGELLTATQQQRAQSAPTSLLGADGPLWYRGSAACHPLLEGPVLRRQLEGLSAQRLVVGHTPTPTRRVRVRLDGQMYAIDTGMLKSVYRGAPYLLALPAENGRTQDVFALDAGSTRTEPAWWHPLLLVPPESEFALVQDVAKGTAVAGAWTSASKKEVLRQQALWRLDRELGLWMTPTIVADLPGKRFFQARRGSAKSWITERERREQGRSFANYCSDGHQNLLISAFDALTGVTTRGLDTLLVHRATGVMRLAPIASAFSTSASLPRYARAPRLPSAMADRLEQLDAVRVKALLGDLLTKRQIKALLQRRDKVLQWPRTKPTIEAVPLPAEEQTG